MGVLSFLPVSFVWRQSQPHARMLLHSATKSSLLSCYCLREKELAQVVQEAREIRPAHPISLAVSLLERRLENVVYRMGFAESIPQARALVRQGHILLNRHLPKNAGIALWPGDVVHYTLDPYNASSTAHLPKRLLPSYLQYLNPHTTDRGMMLSLPTLADCPQQLLKTSAVCSGAVAY